MSVTFQLVIGVGEDRIRDPEGHGPRIWFQVVPEVKAIKNRLHLDINASGGRTVPLETRRQQVDAKGALVATIVRGWRRCIRLPALGDISR